MVYVCPLEPNTSRAQSVRERLGSAHRFLELGKKETEDNYPLGSMEQVREGAEKIFHALADACTARIQKYGLAPPDNHNEVRNRLKYVGDQYLLNLYQDCYADLHVKAYYKGWVDMPTVRLRTTEILKAIEEIEKVVRRP